MATTTPNYGWTVPTSTDLVKDGATAIETLGDAIDASMNTALGTKKAGMVLLNTTSFSGVASQSVNDVFSSTYKSYKITGYIQSDDANANNLLFRVRASGTDLSSGSYRFITSLGDTSSSSFVVLDSSNTGTSILIDRYGPRGGSFEHSIHNPQLTKYTHLTGTASIADGTNARNLLTMGMVNNELAYTGFTLIASAGNMTGRISVYGFQE
jgi:hypothetical protein